MLTRKEALKQGYAFICYYGFNMPGVGYIINKAKDYDVTVNSVTAFRAKPDGIWSIYLVPKPTKGYVEMPMLPKG